MPRGAPTLEMRRPGPEQGAIKRVPKAEAPRVVHTPQTQERMAEVTLAPSANEGFRKLIELPGHEAKMKTQEALARQAQDPEGSKHLLALDKGTQLEADAYLKELRDPVLVGEAAYGKSLVKDCHQKGEDIDHAEEAQGTAMARLSEKIDAGLIDPAVIGTEMNAKLQVDARVDPPPQRTEDVLPRVEGELKGFVEKGLISEQEAAAIQQEAGVFSAYYGEAFAGATPAKIYEATRDHSRIIAYQARMDKNVLVGSDHGVRHILNGNMKFADQLMVGLEAQGVAVSAQDKLLVHAVIAAHDIGYTTGAAQAPGGFEASKDHPLVSAAFVEANKGYYTEMYGEDAYKVIFDSINNHSYVHADFESPHPEGSDINPALIRAITSAVDSLGATADTKIPSFFNNEAAVRELVKIRLAKSLLGQKDAEGVEHLRPDQQDMFDQIMAKRKDSLRQIATGTANEEERQAFSEAVESVNPDTEAYILGQFTGEVTGVNVVRTENGKLVPEVSMQMIDQIGTQVRAMFGGEAELKQFVKVMEDLGMSQAQLDYFGKTVEAARAAGVTVPAEQLRFQTEKAVVQVSSREQVSDEFAAMVPVFNEARLMYSRSEVLEVLNIYDTNPEAFRNNLDQVTSNVTFLIGSEGVDSTRLSNLVQQIHDGDPAQQRSAVTALQETFNSDINSYLLE